MLHIPSKTCCKCKASILTRSGKYGSFWFCPNSTPSDNHGTAKFRMDKPRTRKRNWSLNVGLEEIDNTGEYYDMLAPY